MERRDTDTAAVESGPKMGRCLQCGKPIDHEGCYWRRFCGDKCRALFGSEARRIGMKILIARREQELAEQAAAEKGAA